MRFNQGQVNCKSFLFEVLDEVFGGSMPYPTFSEVKDR